MSFGVPDWLKDIQSRDDFEAFDRKATRHMEDLWWKRTQANKGISGQWGLGTGKGHDQFRDFGRISRAYGRNDKGQQIHKRWWDAPDRWDINKWGNSIDHWKWLYDNHERRPPGKGGGYKFPWEWQGRQASGMDHFTKNRIGYREHLDRLKPITPNTHINREPYRPPTMGKTFKPKTFRTPEQQKRFSPLR